MDLDDITDVAFGVDAIIVDAEAGIAASVNLLCRFTDKDGVTRDLGRAYSVSDAIRLGKTILDYAEAAELHARAIGGDQAAAAALEEKGKQWEEDHSNDKWFN